MIRRPPRSTQSRSSAASDVYKRQPKSSPTTSPADRASRSARRRVTPSDTTLSLIHISEPTRLRRISYAVFCLKKKKKKKKNTKKYHNINKNNKIKKTKQLKQ